VGDTVAEAVKDQEVVITSLANDEAVRSVALGDDGIRTALADGAVYLDASTVSPSLSAELAGCFPRYAAMPIMGSPDAVRAGEAVYLIGGDPTVIESVQPLLAALSRTVRRYEAAPLASTAKLAVNLLLLDGVVALAEAMAVGRSGGLSDEQLSSLLRDSPMVAPGLKNRFDGVLYGHQEPWWSARLGAKDAGLAVTLVETTGGALRATAAARDLYDQVPDPDSQDIADVAQLYR
jgi:3-hydroxyisobutyrate dehydrogenase